MKAFIQKVSSASVSVDDETVGAIGKGLLVLWGVAEGDSESDVRYLAEKSVIFVYFPTTKAISIAP